MVGQVVRRLETKQTLLSLRNSIGKLDEEMKKEVVSDIKSDEIDDFELRMM